MATTYTFETVTKPEDFTDEHYEFLKGLIPPIYFFPKKGAEKLLGLPNDPNLPKLYKNLNPFQLIWIFSRDAQTGKLAGAANGCANKIGVDPNYDGTCHEIYNVVAPEHEGSDLWKQQISELNKEAGKFIGGDRMLALVEFPDPLRMTLKEFEEYDARGINWSRQIKDRFDDGYQEVDLRFVLPGMGEDESETSPIFPKPYDETCRLFAQSANGLMIPTGKLVAQDLLNYFILYAWGEPGGENLPEPFANMIRQAGEQSYIKTTQRHFRGRSNLPNWEVMRSAAKTEKAREVPGWDRNMRELLNEHYPQWKATSLLMHRDPGKTVKFQFNI